MRCPEGEKKRGCLPITRMPAGRGFAEIHPYVMAIEIAKDPETGKDVLVALTRFTGHANVDGKTAATHCDASSDNSDTGFDEDFDVYTEGVWTSKDRGATWTYVHKDEFGHKYPHAVRCHEGQTDGVFDEAVELDLIANSGGKPTWKGAQQLQVNPDNYRHFIVGNRLVEHAQHGHSCRGQENDFQNKKHGGVFTAYGWRLLANTKKAGPNNWMQDQDGLCQSDTVCSPGHNCNVQNCYEGYRSLGAWEDRTDSQSIHFLHVHTWKDATGHPQFYYGGKSVHSAAWNSQKGWYDISHAESDTDGQSIQWNAFGLGTVLAEQAFEFDQDGDGKSDFLMLGVGDYGLIKIDFGSGRSHADTATTAHPYKVIAHQYNYLSSGHWMALNESCDISEEDRKSPDKNCYFFFMDPSSAIVDRKTNRLYIHNGAGGGKDRNGILASTDASQEKYELIGGCEPLNLNNPTCTDASLEDADKGIGLNGYPIYAKAEAMALNPHATGDLLVGTRQMIDDTDKHGLWYFDASASRWSQIDWATIAPACTALSQAQIFGIETYPKSTNKTYAFISAYGGGGATGGEADNVSGKPEGRTATEGVYLLEMKANGITACVKLDTTTLAKGQETCYQPNSSEKSLGLRCDPMAPKRLALTETADGTEHRLVVAGTYHAYPVLYSTTVDLSQGSVSNIAETIEWNITLDFRPKETADLSQTKFQTSAAQSWRSYLVKRAGRGRSIDSEYSHPQFPHKSFAAFAVSPKNKAIIIASLYGNLKKDAYTPLRVYRSVDGGSTWTIADELESLPTKRVVEFNFSEDGERLYFSLGGAGLYVAPNPYDTSFKAAMPSMSTPTHLTVGGSEPLLSFAAHPIDHRIRMVGTDTGGVFRTLDGKNWENVSHGLSSNFVESIAFTTGQRVYLGTSNGVYVSENLGKKWTLQTTGMREGIGIGDQNEQTHPISAVATDATNHQLAYAAVGNLYKGKIGQRCDPYHLYRTTDAGKTWEPILSLDPEFIDQTEPLSKEECTTAKESATRTVAPHITEIQIHPTNGNTVYVASDKGLYVTYNAQAPVGDIRWRELGRKRLHTSKDLGRNWTSRP